MAIPGILCVVEILTDASAARGCVKGAFIARHQKSLWRYLRFLGCADAHTEDYLHDAFLVALERGIHEKPPAAGAAWLRTTVRNLLFNDLRRAARRPTRVALDLAQLEASWEQHADHFPEYLDALLRCLPALDRRDRAALEQRYRLGWSRQRMAQELGISAAGVKSLLQRIRGRLRHEVERRLEENER